MDRPRIVTRRRVWPVAVAAVIAAGALVLVATRTPAAPAVERTAIVIATVERGPFVHDISAAGALVAEQPRLIAAPSAGRVERIEIEQGDALQKGQVLLRLSNRDTVRQLLEAEQRVAEAEADLADLRATLQARSLESEKTLRRTQYEKQDALRQAEASSQLATEGLVSNLDAVRHREASQEVAERVSTERQRHEALTRSANAQIDAARNRIERLRALVEFHRALVDALIVRAPADTTAREILVQEGEWVNEGHRLVRLVEPGRLKAVLRVPEATAHEVRVGQRVFMSARGTELRGVVQRIAATVEEGSVAAEVHLQGELPQSARPDLSVDGRIEISRTADALTLARPLSAMPNTSVQLFKLDAKRGTAQRTGVRFGSASIERIVVTAGAEPGDRFIVAGLDGRTEPVIRVE
jgi:multidrug efflux pump subunit AcrA (membrane-fusion protein)